MTALGGGGNHSGSSWRDRWFCNLWCGRSGAPSTRHAKARRKAIGARRKNGSGEALVISQPRPMASMSLTKPHQSPALYIPRLPPTRTIRSPDANRRDRFTDRDLEKMGEDLRAKHDRSVEDMSRI